MVPTMLSPGQWAGTNVLWLTPPGASHSIWWFFDARHDLTLPHRVAELDVDVLKPPVGTRHHFHSCRADQIPDDGELFFEFGQVVAL